MNTTDDKSIGALSPNEQPSRQRFIMVAILFVTLLVAYVDRVNVSVLVVDPHFLADMGIAGKPVQMGLLMTVFLIAYGISNAVLGPLGDYLGPRKAMSLSLFLWGVSMLIGGLAPVFAMMLVSRVVLGSGEGMHWPMQSKYVKNWFPPQERAKANSIWLMGLFIGPAIGMPFFTWIVSAMPWRTTFFFLAGLSFVPLILLWFFTTDHPHQHKKINAAELEHIEAGLKAEALAEAQAEHTTVWENMKSFIFNYRFWLITVYYLCQCSIWWGTMAWLPSYLKVARGFSWASMGMWSTLPYVLGTVVLIFSGWLSDKVGRRAPFPLIGMLGVSICIYTAAYAESNIVAAILLSVAIGFVAFASSAIWTLLQQVVPGKAIGSGAGLMNGVANGGSALAPILIGYFISIAGSYVGGLLLLVGLAVVAAICAGILTLQKY